jgi:hypothetical protein
MKKKLFISHAMEDQPGFVRPLAKSLSGDFDVWYSEYQLVVGMSLFEEISKGLASCDYGIVVLSTHFFAKKWPQQELNGLFTLEEKDKKVILPVWHGLTQDQVKKHSPILADRVAAKSDDGLEVVVKEIKRAVTYFDRGKAIQTPRPGLAKLRSTLQRRAEADRSEGIVSSDGGVALARATGQAAVDLVVAHLKSLVDEGITGIRIDGPKGNNVEYFANVWLGSLCLRMEYRNQIINSARDARLDVALIDAELNPWGQIKGHKEVERERYALFVAQNDEPLWKPEDQGEAVTADELVNTWVGKLSDGLEDKMS